MKLIIGGVDVTHFVARDGVKWSRNDVDKDSGRTLDGTMQRGRVTTKVRLDVTLVPMTEENLRPILQALMPVSTSVTYTDPLYGEVTKTMYANNHSVKLNVEDSKGVRIYKDISFPLIEI